MTRPVSPDLARIAEAALDADLLALHRHKERVAAITAEIADLRSGPATETAFSALWSGPAGSRENLSWISWRNRRLVRLQAQLAAERAAREEILERTRRSFGRKTAIDKLIARQKADRARRTRP